MIHYLKAMHGDTLVAAYGAEFDLNILITLSAFSKLLFTIPKSRRDEFIEDFEQVQDMRNEWFEAPEFQEANADTFLETRLRVIAEKWNLYYQTDRPIATPRPEETPFQADTFRGEVSRRVHHNPRRYGEPPNRPHQNEQYPPDHEDTGD